MVQDLWDIEQIKQLKARYFRLLDTKDWDAFAELFTDDCHHVLPSAEPKPPQSNEEYLAGLRSALGDGMTVHHGHMPEIEITGPTTATGIWAMFDYVELPEFTLRGYGHYHEEYVKQRGGWKIQRIRLTRLRCDVTPGPQTGAAAGA